MIPWFPGGHCDPWNHVEAAMALTVVGHGRRGRPRLPVAGRHPAPRRQLVQLLPDDRGRRTPVSTPTCVPTWPPGAWHRYVSTGDLDGLEKLWPAVEAGVDFVLRWQRPDGSIRWSLDPAGRPRGVRAPHRLVLDLPQPPLRDRLRRATRPRASRLGARRGPAGPRRGPRARARSRPRCEFAMDWYYPVLSGALSGDRGHGSGSTSRGRPS